MIRGKKCTRVVPISKANSGPGCYCRPFISGALGSCLRFDGVWVPFLFPRQAKPSLESGIHHLWERLVFISRRHFPRRAICRGEKKKKKRNSEDGGEVFSKVVTEKISHHSQQFLLPLSGFYLSLYTVYLIFLTKPITALFLQPLQLDSASYWPFTRLLYNTRNH